MDAMNFQLVLPHINKNKHFSQRNDKTVAFLTK